MVQTMSSDLPVRIGVLARTSARRERNSKLNQIPNRSPTDLLKRMIRQSELKNSA